MSDDGKAYSLNAMHGHDMHVVCYAIDHVITTGGNCTAQGPCVYEELCPTLKASGAHAVCFACAGGTPAVCFQSGQRSRMNSIGISRSCLKGGNGSNGGMPVEENLIPSMTANGCGAVCYETKDNGNVEEQNHLPESVGQPE